jgi:hypothetical protein
MEKLDLNGATFASYGIGEKDEFCVFYRKAGLNPQ